MNDSPRVLGNRYEVGDLLGRGGMAEVHLGRDTRLGRTVAIKLLRTDLARDPTFQARFQREAQSAAALNHPAIVAVYDTGEEQIVESGGALVTLPYIVMEYIEGRTLREELGQGQYLDVDSSLAIMTGVLAALEYSHRVGIVHRDIKPANVMLTPTGEIKVMDFGIARAVADASSMTQTQAVIGTAQYLSPEQARGEQVDARSDLYSAGCLLFELLTGRPPFVADSPVAVAYQHVREQPAPPSHFVAGIPEAVDQVVLHSLTKDREHRYQSAAQFRADVEALRAGHQVQAPAAMATTQLVAAQDGTRAMTSVAGGGLLPGSAVDYADSYLPPATPAEGEQPRGRGPLIAGLLVVLAVVGLSIAAFSGLFSGSSDGDIRTVEVPQVIGQTSALATRNLAQRGLTDVDIVNKFSADAPAGQVLAVDPAVGSQVSSTTKITLTVSKGVETAQVPRLVGMTQAKATEALAAVGLKVGDVISVDDSSAPANSVVGTDPGAGRTLPVGSAVDLRVANSTVTVPQLVGLTRDAAHAALQARGLRWTDVAEESSTTAPGTVLRQSVPSGTAVGRDQRITLTIATNPTPVPTSASPSASPSATATTEPAPDPTATEPAPDPTSTL